MNLRDRARTLLQGLTTPQPPPVQPFNVVCSEGHRLSGQRTSGYQALRCPSCGDGIFVLPRSPLPEPPQPTSPPRARQATVAASFEPDPRPIALTDPVMAGESPEGEVVWLDESPGVTTRDPAQVAAEVEAVAAEFGPIPVPGGPDVAPRSPPRARSRPGAVATNPATRTKKPRSGPLPDRVEVESGDRIKVRVRLADWARRRRNPLLFLAVGLLIVATVGIRQWRQRRQDLPRIAALGRVEGLSALDEGKFDKAYQLLSEARRAVESLGDAVEGAGAIRQGAAEAAIFVNLVPERLETIIDEAGRYDPKEWPDHFDTYYRGRSIIIDGHVTDIPDASGKGAYALDYQIVPDGEGKPLRVGRIDLNGFRLFENTQPKEGDRVQFGARLASFLYDERADEWRVGLEPDSGVFLTHPRALEALGWPNIADLTAEGGDRP